MVCIDLLKDQFLKQELWESFVPDSRSLFKVVESF